MTLPKFGYRRLLTIALRFVWFVFWRKMKMKILASDMATAVFVGLVVTFLLTQRFKRII